MTKQQKERNYWAFPGMTKPKTSKDIIIDSVCNRLGVTKDEIMSRRRFKHIVEARQIAMYVIHKRISCTLDEIGRVFNGLDHSTVLYSIKTVSNFIEMKDRVGLVANELVRDI